uniref:Saposin B-type domain-containing protein n=1 Tax=Caenorhabditis japonica TaxID=281687 RepID=A0A8R1I2I5_CAEJA
MKFIIVALALLFGSAVAYKNKMLELNRIMTEDASGSPCEACQNFFKEFAVEWTPGDIELTKKHAINICRRSSSAEDCRIFVSKFIDQGLSYLKDPHAVCARLHICGNKKMDAFRHVMLDYAKRGDKIFSGVPAIVCDECEFVVKELKAALENQKMQTDARDFLRENVCKNLGQYRGYCDHVVDEYLPQFIQEIDAVLENPHQVCVDVYACEARAVFKPRKYVGLAGYFQRNFL